MNKIYKLKNQIKHYEWGSSKIMPEFLGIKTPGNVPYAEMWMGTHKGAPSQTNLNGKISLEEISGELPFLFKLLAVDKPLSLQAHPNREKAQEGFRLEEEAGMDIKSPMRNYKDNGHKTELLCALSRFTIIAGFKTAAGINKTLNEFLVVFPQLKEIISPLQRSFKTDSLAVFFRILNNFSKLEREYIRELLINKEIPLKGDVILPEQWELIKRFAIQYPDDPAILSPLYLNYITLQPGQAIYIPSGVLHSYISGFGVEIMSASDNVLRGGLTPKYIDIPELMNIVCFDPYNPKILSPVYSSWFCFGSKDFSLAIMEGDGQEKPFQGKGPGICLVTDGELLVENTSFKKGESFYIPKNNDELLFSGNFSAFFASPPLKSNVTVE